MRAKRRSMRSTRKVFSGGSTPASEPGYWEDHWAQAAHGDDPPPGVVMREILAFMPDTGLVLEAGCGAGGPLMLLEATGRSVVGLDFAAGTLMSLRDRMPQARLVVGNLMTLPLAQGSFDVVISLGAIEHDQRGPDAALVEHRRVLRHGGLFLVSVPRLSWLKRWNDFLHLTLARRSMRRSPRGRMVTRVRDTHIDERHDSGFIQYEFRRRTFREHLQSSGFEVVATRAHLTSAGIGESSFARRWIGSHSRPTYEGHGDPCGDSHHTERTYTSGIRRVVLGEEASGLSTRALRWVSREWLAHMDLFVARAC